MADGVDPAVIKQTQETLGKYVKKPPLSDKLLKKPPFRFLHDVLCAVIKETGFYDGLYTADELKSENVKDKEGKVAFLQKAVDVLSLATGETLSVRPSKIVAGHEANKTNEFLQLLAKALDSNISSDDAVQRVLNGEKPAKGGKKLGSKPESTKKPKEPKASTSSDRTKLKDDKKKERNKVSDKENKTSKPKKDRPKGRDKDKDKNIKDRSARNKTKPDESPRNNEISPPVENSPRDDVNTEIVNGDGETGIVNGVAETEMNGEIPDALPDLPIESNGEPAGVIDELPVMGEETTKSSPTPLPKPSRPPSERRPKSRVQSGIQKQKLNQGRNSELDDDVDQVPVRDVPPDPAAPPPDVEGTSAVLGEVLPGFDNAAPAETQPPAADSEIPEPPPRPPTVRPPTSTKVRLKTARPPSARPAPPKVKDKVEDEVEEPVRPQTGKVTNVIVDGGEEKDEDDLFTVEETKLQNLQLEEDAPTASTPRVDQEELLAKGQHGSLVHQILETQKELEEGGKKAELLSPAHTKIEIERSPMTEQARKKERDLIQKDINKLRGTIQTLARSANPLAKMMDFLQEDVDSMQKELETWQRENKQHAQALKREEALTETALEPLKVHLNDLEQAVVEQQDKISTVKSNIQRNEERIQKLLAGINMGAKG